MRASLLLTLVLSGSGLTGSALGGSRSGAGEGAGTVSVDDIAARIAPRLETGALIFSEGDCLAVRAYTGSTYTHVAAVVVQEGTPFVYDATNGVGVRKQTLAYYLASQAPDQIHLFRPATPIEGERAVKFEKYLESQLGRPYSINQHLTGDPCKGMHCAEYVTEALMTIDVLHANRPAKVSPASLREGIMEHGIYGTEEHFRIAPPEPPPQVASNRCEQLWIDTKLCCASCCRKMKGWFACE